MIKNINHFLTNSRRRSPRFCVFFFFCYRIAITLGKRMKQTVKLKKELNHCVIYCVRPGNVIFLSLLLARFSKRFRKRFAAGRLFKFFLKIPFLSAAYIPNSLTFWLNEKLPRRYLRFEDAECCRLGRRIIVTSRILIIVDFVQRIGINIRSDFFFFPRYKDVTSCHPNYPPILTSFVSRLYARLSTYSAGSGIALAIGAF